MNSITCPKCGTTEVQKASVICEAGTVDISGSISGSGASIGSGGVRFGAGGGSIQAIKQSKLVQKLSPPVRVETPWPVIYAGVPLVLLGLILWIKIETMTGFAYALICWALAVAVTKALMPGYEEKEAASKAAHEKAYAEWERMWYCHKCGNTFQVES